MEKINKDKIIEALNSHGVIAFPTETVMGLGVYFDDELAFQKLNNVKERPSDKPYTLMLNSKESIANYAVLNERDKRIIEHFMPGPITILVKAKENIPPWVDLGTGIIGIRVPEYETTKVVLEACGKPLLVPSANKSGQSPAMNSEEVYKIFENNIDYIVKGTAGMQKPSTIIDLTKKDIKIIREGPVSLDTIKDILGGSLWL